MVSERHHRTKRDDTLLHGIIKLYTRRERQPDGSLHLRRHADDDVVEHQRTQDRDQSPRRNFQQGCVVDELPKTTHQNGDKGHLNLAYRRHCGESQLWQKNHAVNMRMRYRRPRTVIRKRNIGSGVALHTAQNSSAYIPLQD